jgi:hypothetical protein
MRRTLFLIALMAGGCCGQKLHVYSPLTRVDPSGGVIKADRGKTQPRHILSPGVPRNAYSSLRVVVELDRPEAYTLDIGQNPENAVKATLYREIFVETANGWIPDSLQAVSIPYKGFPTDFRLPGQRVVTFWLDMWVHRKAEVDRVKVEPQLYVASIDDWVVYPMEVRIQSPVARDLKMTYSSRLPAVTAPSDETVRGPLRAAMCGVAEASGTRPPQLTARDLLRRNVVQHMSLAGDKASLQSAFHKASGMDAETWCKSPSTPPTGPEWYLRLRDLIYRLAGAED